MRSLALALVLAALALTACSSAPAQSTQLACKDFVSWQHAQDGNNDSGNDMAELKAAVAAAPSGQLYSDLGDLKINVSYSQTHPQGDSQTGSDVQIVQGDCSSVNPAG